MGWERRKGSKKAYYTWTLTVGGKRTRVYLGRAGDPVAETAAAHDGLERINVELDKRKWAAEVEAHRLRPIQAAVDVALANLAGGLAAHRQGPPAGPAAQTPGPDPS